MDDYRHRQEFNQMTPKIHVRGFTSLMLVVNVLAFLYSMYLNNWKFESFSDNPTFGPSAAVLDDLGAKDSAKILHGEYWRLLTAAFLHGGVIHILMNMHMLWRLGGSIEQAFGWWRCGIVYLSAGISGNLLSAVFLPLQISVGASGALVTLLIQNRHLNNTSKLVWTNRALFGDFLHNYKIMGGNRLLYVLNLIINAAFGLAIGLLPIVDNFAHVGGFICGFFAGSIVLIDQSHRHRTKSKPCYSILLVILACAAIIAWFAALTIVLFFDYDPKSICSWCHYADCLETPYWTCCVPQIDRATGKTIPC